MSLGHPAKNEAPARENPSLAAGETEREGEIGVNGSRCRPGLPWRGLVPVASAAVVASATEAATAAAVVTPAAETAAPTPVAAVIAVPVTASPAAAVIATPAAAEASTPAAGATLVALDVDQLAGDAGVGQAVQDPR